MPDKKHKKVPVTQQDLVNLEQILIERIDEVEEYMFMQFRDHSLGGPIR